MRDPGAGWRLEDVLGRIVAMVGGDPYAPWSAAIPIGFFEPRVGWDCDLERLANDRDRRLKGVGIVLGSTPDIVGGAEKVLRVIVEILLKPSIELRQLAKDALSKGLDPDPLLAFSSTCRADLDNVRRTTV